MARLYLRSGLTAASAAVLAAGCARDLPLDIFLEDAWTGLELDAVEEAIAEWNAVAETRLSEPGPVFNQAGRTADTFNLDDFQDAMHVIYRIGEPTPEYMELESKVGEMDGYGTYSDVLLVAFKMPRPWTCSEESFREMRPDDDYAEYLAGVDPAEFHENCVADLRAVALHELGHFIGLAHFTHRPSIMSDSEFPDTVITHLTDADIEAFCLVYDCR